MVRFDSGIRGYLPFFFFVGPAHPGSPPLLNGRSALSWPWWSVQRRAVRSMDLRRAP